MENYKILFDYNTEGFQFQDGVFSNVNDAVKHALELNYNNKFLIVKIINWKAEELST